MRGVVFVELKQLQVQIRLVFPMGAEVACRCIVPSHRSSNICKQLPFLGHGRRKRESRPCRPSGECSARMHQVCLIFCVRSPKQLKCMWSSLQAPTPSDKVSGMSRVSVASTIMPMPRIASAALRPYCRKAACWFGPHV